MAKQAQKSKFMQWYESYEGKKVVNMVYCLGASVVIVGALFKIMHFPGAGPLLMLGMCTEALLFAIGCLDKPHVEFKWSNVFPQLIGEGADPEELEELASKPRPTLLGMGSENGTADAKKANVPALTDKEFEALKGSITDLAHTASQLSELGKIAETTNKLTEKMNAAGSAADRFVESQNKLVTGSEEIVSSQKQVVDTQKQMMDAQKQALAQVAESQKSIATATTAMAGSLSKNSTDLTSAYQGIINEIGAVAKTTKDYGQQATTINQRLTALNSVYELQINAMQAQVNAFNTQTAQINNLSQSVQKVQNATTEAAKSSEAYQEEAQKLSKQVADLNKIYGNMLTALK